MSTWHGLQGTLGWGTDDVPENTAGEVRHRLPEGRREVHHQSGATTHGIAQDPLNRSVRLGSTAAVQLLLEPRVDGHRITLPR